MVWATTLPSFLTWMVERDFSVPWVVISEPSASSNATPWWAASVLARSALALGSAILAESTVVMSPVPSANSVVRPLCSTTWPACLAG